MKDRHNNITNNNYETNTFKYNNQKDFEKHNRQEYLKFWHIFQ